MSAATATAWDESAEGRFPMHDDSEIYSEDAPCQACSELRAELARARQLLKSIAKVEAKAAKAELLEDATEALVVGQAMALAGIRARIELFLGRKA
jgi:hypothetical protein